MNNRLILLVEDNPDDEFLAMRAFQKNNMTDVMVVRDGQEAVEYLFEQGAFDGRDTSIMPQVIFLDLKLPKLDGVDVLKRIRKNEKTHMIPVVMLTSSNEESDIANCYENGANSFICKPVNFKEFVEASKQMGTYWLSLNVTSVTLN